MCSCVLTVSAGRSGGQHKAAVGAACGPVLDDPIGILGKGAAMAFVPRLGPAGAGLLAAFLAVRGGRLGGGARGLLRTLQPQHQLDQFVLAQAFEIGASHDGTESASSAPRKGGAPAERSASRQPRRPNPLGNCVSFPYRFEPTMPPSACCRNGSLAFCLILRSLCTLRPVRNGKSDQSC